MNTIGFGQLDNNNSWGYNYINTINYGFIYDITYNGETSLKGVQN